jgi:type 1 fimbria pilin
MNPKNKKVYILLLIAISITVIAISSNIRSNGSHSIPNRSPTPVYSWKSGAVQVRGDIVPATCALTTKSCVCNLSESNQLCLFNFNLSGLNQSARIQAKHNASMPSIIYTASPECQVKESGQIENCSVTFKWSNSGTGEENTQIQLDGPSGTQPLINLRIKVR